MPVLRSLSENDGYMTDVALNHINIFTSNFFFNLLSINEASRFIIFLAQVLLIKSKRELDV